MTVDDAVDDAVQNVQIRRIDEVRHLGPVLAAWHAAEWSHLYEPTVWDESTARREFQDQAATAEHGPTTFVAVDGHGDPLGSISLVTSDDLPGYEHLTPWLASLYVVPEARGRGLGATLLRHGVEQARRLGFLAIHLFTADHAGWYADLGWEALATTTMHGHAVTVMRLTLA